MGLLNYALTALILAGLAGASTAQPSGVRHLLTGYEWQLDRQQFEKLTGNTRDELIAIVTDTGEVPYIRSRGLAALVLYPDQEVWEVHLALLVEAETINRRRIVDALCETFRSLRPAQLEAVLTPYLKDPDAHLRIRSARCLLAVNSVGARGAVSDYIQSLTAEDQAWELAAVRVPARTDDP